MIEATADPAKASSTMATPCAPSTCDGADTSQARRQPESASTPAASPQMPPTSAGRVGNARMASRLATSRIGAAIVIGHFTHSYQNWNAVPGGSSVGSIAYVTTVTSTMRPTAPVSVAAMERRDSARPGTAWRNATPRIRRPAIHSSADTPQLPNTPSRSKSRWPYPNGAYSITAIAIGVRSSRRRPGPINGRTGLMSRATMSWTRRRVSVRRSVIALLLVAKEPAQTAAGAAGPQLGRARRDAKPRGDLPKTQAAPMVQQERAATVGRYLAQRRQQLRAIGETVRGRRHFALRHRGQLRALRRLAALHLADVHEEHALRDRVHPRTHRQTGQVAAPRSVNLKKRLLEQVVHALRIVASRAQEPAQLCVERSVETI